MYGTLSVSIPSLLNIRGKRLVYGAIDIGWFMSIGLDVLKTTVLSGGGVDFNYRFKT